MGVSENLCRRFPHISEELIKQALEEAGGHGGKAINILSRHHDVNSSRVRRVCETDSRLVKQAFRTWDEDGSGTLSTAEWKQVLISLGIQPNTAQRLFPCVDSDSSGQIDIDELLNWIFDDSTSLEPGQGQNVSFFGDMVVEEKRARNEMLVAAVKMDACARLC
eukprot:TRINITY_DN57260_c0_g1_i1.p1 TRINITY_DN57260_c0_g1~~TRINITY_DN57260_c0_g1_i1.p1  ORF type:complete len:164 (+),score=25.90 TRINITY_DN57260_c0_g1_i1:109-600(+)